MSLSVRASAILTVPTQECVLRSRHEANQVPEPRLDCRAEAASKAEAHLGHPDPLAAPETRPRLRNVQCRDRQQATRLRPRPPPGHAHPPRRLDPAPHHHCSAENRSARSVRANRVHPRSACFMAPASRAARQQLAPFPAGAAQTTTSPRASTDGCWTTGSP